MGVLDRLKVVLTRGASIVLAPAPDPRVTNLTAHQKQRALLDQVKRASGEVSAAKVRLRETADQVRRKLPAMEEQARHELHAGNEAMARLALQRREVVAHELATLERQLGEVEKEESALAVIELRLTGQIEAFAARQEVIKARYSAAEAQVRINEAMTAIAIDRLVREGDIAIGFGSGGFNAGSDAIDARYQALGADEDVERRLRALKELG
jgi:phage shock protein A